jgi:hypothetical protein
MLQVQYKLEELSVSRNWPLVALLWLIELMDAGQESVIASRYGAAWEGDDRAR